jgi:hypothetical protein
MENVTELKKVSTDCDENNNEETQYQFMTFILEYVEIGVGEKAKYALDQYEFECGTKIQVDWCPNEIPVEYQILSPIAKTNYSPIKGIGKIYSIHITYETKDPDVLVTEERLRDIVSGYGDPTDITNVIIINQKDHKVNEIVYKVGYGFVDFKFTPEGYSFCVDVSKVTYVLYIYIIYIILKYIM